MAEIKGYIYEEIKNLAIGKKINAQHKIHEKYDKELEQVKQDAEKELTPEVLKAANIKVSFECAGYLKVEVKIPEDKEKAFEEKFQKLRSVIQKKIAKENNALEKKYEEWLCEFAKKANEGIVIELPNFD